VRKPALTPEYRCFVRELFAGLGAIEIRPLFNFVGLFHEATIFGIVADGRIYLKCDGDMRTKFAEFAGSPFRFRARDGNEIVTSYYEIPARVCDEPDEAAKWARAALEVALNSANTRRKERRRLKGGPSGARPRSRRRT
jgi:DNA transformation protein and related proteins